MTKTQNTVTMTFEILINQQKTEQAVQLLSARGFGFMCGKAEHTDDTIVYLHGCIGDLDSAEKLLASENLAYTW